MAYPIMTGSDQFIVIVSEKRFVLTKAQLEFDSPNYLSKWFLENASRFQDQILELTRDPDLFRLVVDHLSGYSVVSLSPPTISLPGSRTLNDLLADAAFYELATLKSFV
ncbi:hypothetical protein FRC06_000849 [Ceratobasidium sp. 370]|nr:hypothetical protein FRC06_000849 [Ceratobasidium sp. 370]